MDIDKLKALALAATPGAWANWGRHIIPEAHWQRRLGGSTDKERDREDYAHLICRVDGKYQPDHANAEYIAAACPAAVLELIAEIERLRAAYPDQRSVVYMVAQAQANAVRGFAEAIVECGIVNSAISTVFLDYTEKCAERLVDAAIEKEKA
jgi:hypothetical protein